MIGDLDWDMCPFASERLNVTTGIQAQEEGACTEKGSCEDLYAMMFRAYQLA